MNSAAIEKPIDRTFGGIASDSDAKMPGTNRAERPETTKFIAIATPSVGASANAVHAAAMTMPRIASSRRPSPGSRSMRRDASGMPSRIASIWPGSANAATTPRW